VALASGEELSADLVISTIHPQAMVQLLDPDQLKASFRRRITSLANTGGMAAVHALVPAGSHATIDHNLFVVGTEPFGDARDLLYLQLRESEKSGYNLLSLLTSGHDRIWSSWSNTLTGRRGEQYQQAKAVFANRLVAEAEQTLGKLPGLEVLDVWTPLTVRDWNNSPDGSAYGVLRSSEQMLSAALLNRTSCEGLFQAGQSVLAPGILGTILGSLATVQFIVGPQRFRREVRI
jgi:all-trans-retinol 13,14-reductase